MARVGSYARQEVTVLGEQVNLSSCLQALSEVGWGLLDEAPCLACGEPRSTPTMFRVRGMRDLLFKARPAHIPAVV